MEFIDLTERLKCDTYFIVKFGKAFCHYTLFQERKDGTPVLYGELYDYFIKKDDFRFAKGYVLEEDYTHWKAREQYFYFDRGQVPIFDHRTLKHYLLKPKTTKFSIKKP